MIKLIDGGRNLQTLAKDFTLSLKENIAGPFDVTGDVSLGL